VIVFLQKEIPIPSDDTRFPWIPDVSQGSYVPPPLHKQPPSTSNPSDFGQAEAPSSAIFAQQGFS